MLTLMYLFLVYPISISSIVQDFYWRDYIYGDIPCDAYQGAPGKYIGQINFRGQNLPATIYTNSGTAVAEYGGKQSAKDDIKILCSSDQSRLYWEYVDLDKAQDQQMQDAVKGGFQGNEHYQLFIGKVIHDEEWIIGKVHGYETPEVKGLWIWGQDQKGIKLCQFFILKYNITSSACYKQCNYHTMV